MILLIAIMSALGGMAIGYSVKHIQDSYYLREIKSTYDELEELLRNENKQQRATISRLNSILNDRQIKANEHKVVEYVDVVFPNREV